MTDRSAKPPTAASGREARLAKALRANLLRRKAQARAKEDAATNVPAGKVKPAKP